VIDSDEPILAERLSATGEVEQIPQCLALRNKIFHSPVFGVSHPMRTMRLGPSDRAKQRRDAPNGGLTYVGGGTNDAHQLGVLEAYSSVLTADHHFLSHV